MRAIWHIALKDLRLVVRDGAGLFWMLAFPLIMALFFGSVFGGFDSDGGKGKLKVAVTDLTGGAEYAKAFTALLDSSDALVVSHTTLDSARNSVRRGKHQAYIALKPDTAAANESFEFYPGGVPTLEVGIDPARQAEAAYLKGAITQAHYSLVMNRFTNPSQSRVMYDSFLRELDTATGIPEQERKALNNLFGGLKGYYDLVDTASAQGDTTSAGESASNAGPFAGLSITEASVLRERVGPRSSFEITFPQSLMWALIGCATAFSLTIVTERVRGTLIRLRLAPITRAHILGGKALACFIAAVTLCAILLLIGIVVFGVAMDDPAKLVLAVVCCGLCFTGVMMLISNLGRTEQAVAGAGWAILLVMSMTGGGMVPLIAMPEWMVSIGTVSPVRWGITALEGAIWRNYSYPEMAQPLLILAGIGLFGFACGVWLLSRREV